MNLRALLLSILVPVRDVDSAGVASVLRKASPAVKPRSWEPCPHCSVLVSGAHACAPAARLRSVRAA